MHFSKGREMLVLSRKKDQEILLDGGRVRLQVLDIRGNQVRFGIEAPDDVEILRGELVDRDEEKQAA